MDLEELTYELLEQNPSCRVCGGPAETIRQASNPWWGLDASGNPREEINDWIVEVDPSEIVGVCWEHLRTARRASGGWHDPRERAASTNWMERRKIENEAARGQLISHLGGACMTCQARLPDEEMRVLVPERQRRDFGVGTRAEWYKLILRVPELLKRAQLFCVGCGPARTSTNERKASVREQVVAAYGGRCNRTGCGRIEKLMVVALSGTPALRWPNGDKYSSAAKLAYLNRSGYPQGWGLACSSHRADVQRG